jgi:hypothetical protein
MSPSTIVVLSVNSLVTTVVWWCFECSIDALEASVAGFIVTVALALVELEAPVESGAPRWLADGDAPVPIAPDPVAPGEAGEEIALDRPVVAPSVASVRLRVAPRDGFACGAEVGDPPERL